MITPVKDALDNIENGTFKTLRVKRMELLPGDFIFPCQQEQLYLDESKRIPQLDDQNCFAQGDSEPIDFYEALEGTELLEELHGPMDETSEQRFSVMSDEEFRAAIDEAAAGRELRNDKEGSERPPKGGAEASSSSRPPIPMHDPTRLPSGKPVPKGYNWDGVRLVRNKKGSKRPPDTPSEFWHMYSPKQREEDIARYQRKLELEEERKRREAEAESPAMPVIRNSPKEPHREKMFHLYWDKLGEIADQQLALVARLVSQAEVDRTPDAKAAMDKEWKKLADKACWLEKKVREYRDVVKQHQEDGTKAHFGRIFEICSQKGSELPDGDPNKKWKGRSVFQGNRVADEYNDHAIFSELSSSPASMEAGKIMDVFGSQPGYSKQQSDARQAYTQALFDGVETWVRLPKSRWPAAWKNMHDPICPLRLALYGHPDSGGLWERHCQQELEKVGWTAVLPEIWQSIFYHAELDLMLVIYVDDFKMAGPSDHLSKGWDTISSVIDMDPAEVAGRYFGCNHFEERQIKLPREAHPFAYVFDKQESACAGLRAEPTRTEDYWSVDLDLGAVVRHHLYPRKRLYVPTEDDVHEYPTMRTQRITQMDNGQTITDDFNEGGAAKQKGWWTGKTYFPIVDDQIPTELAAAAKGKARSKTEAKREAKQQRFKDPSTIQTDPVPAMDKPVNVMTYDMKEFLSSCVDSTLKQVATPFHENRIAKPVDDKEPAGRLQPIASRVLMKILFAARMARWDLLRATQSLASRVTKWSRDCDVALHRLVCYIMSSLDVRMQGFIGDRVNECQLWLFCDADWAGEFDSKSTSGCALYLVGPNTYYPLNAFSKKQTSITTSSTESEVVSANHGIRAQGLPSLSLWCFLWKEIQVISSAGRKAEPTARNPQEPIPILTKFDPEIDEIRYGGADVGGRSVANLNSLNVHLSDKFKVQMMEDNQATITIILKGDSEKLRHTDKTQRISFAWLRQQFERGLFNMINVDTKEQVADIFTKPFADRAKWLRALRLINHNLTGDQGGKPAKDSDSHLLSRPYVCAGVSTEPSAKVNALELALKHLQSKDFSFKALQEVIESLQAFQTRKQRRAIKSKDSHAFYHVFGQWVHGGLQGVTQLSQKNPEICKYLCSFVAHHAPKDFTWTSLVVSVQTQVAIHRDAHNQPDSCNFLVSCGNHSGGELWIEDSTVPDKYAVYQEDPTGNTLKGRKIASKHKPVLFAPKTKHCVLPHEGTRMSLTAYTSRGFHKLTSYDLGILNDLRFRLPPDPAARAASARLGTRPHCNRVLVEFCCSPNSKLGETRPAAKGCHVLRVTSEDDATKPQTIRQLVEQIHTLCDEGGVMLLLFASLPCTGGSSWQRMNVYNNPERIAEHRALFRKLFRSFCDVIKQVKRHDPQIIFELPRTCDYWKEESVVKFVKQNGLHPEYCDGCMAGITNDKGEPIKKQWTLMSSFPLPHIRDIGECDGTHSHGESRGKALKLAEGYSYLITDAIHEDFKQAIPYGKSTSYRRDTIPDKLKSQPHQTSHCACAFLREEPTSVAAMSRIQLKDGRSGILPSGQGNPQLLEYWHGNLWASVWAAELIDADDQPLQAAALNSLYKGIPAQLAVAMSTKDYDLHRLPLVANIADEGLSLLSPESVRGILRALVIVTDSTTMLRAGRRTTTDLDRDLQGLRRDLLCNYEVVEYHPMWGKTLPTLVKKALELSDQLERRFAGPITGQQLEIDFHIVWSGNELVGDDGIFLHPNIPNWMVEQRGGMMAAQGDWPTIADRISRALGTYASLRGRPSTGFLSLLGGIDAAIFQLPEKMNEVNDLFFKLARSMDILTCDITSAFAGQAMFDEFHLRSCSSRLSPLFTLEVVATRPRMKPVLCAPLRWVPNFFPEGRRMTCCRRLPITVRMTSVRLSKGKLHHRHQRNHPSGLVSSRNRLRPGSMDGALKMTLRSRNAPASTTMTRP